MFASRRTSSASRAERVVATYADLVMRVCLSRLGNEHDARDACQTVLLKYVCLDRDGLLEFANPEHEKAWLIRCAITTCIDLQREAWARKVDSLDDPAAPPSCNGGPTTPPGPEPAYPTAASPEDPAVALERDELNDQVLASVNALAPALRQAVYLHYYEGYAVKDIAKLTGESPATVSQHLSRARAKLRAVLEGGDQ